MRRMGTDIAHTTTFPTSGRICSPCCLNTACILDSLGQPTLRVLHKDLADLADQAFFNQVFCLFYHRITHISMGQCQHQTSFFNHLCQGFSFIKGKCYRFIDNNMETIPQSQNSRLKMSMVWCYYGNEIHPDIRWQFLFLFDHFLKRRINTIRWQGQIFTRLGRNLWSRTECPAYQIYLPIQQGCRSMNCTNKRSLSPTDHRSAER